MQNPEKDPLTLITSSPAEGWKAMKTSLICFLIFFGSILSAEACEVCQRNQPKLLQDISHGTGPQSQNDYYIIAGAVILVFFTLFYSLKYLIRPGEQNPGHIKNLILNLHS